MSEKFAGPDALATAGEIAHAIVRWLTMRDNPRDHWSYWHFRSALKLQEVEATGPQINGALQRLCRLGVIWKRHSYVSYDAKWEAEYRLNPEIEETDLLRVLGR